MPKSLPTAFSVLKRSDLPVTFRAFRTDNDEQVWEEQITEAADFAQIRIPPLAKEHGSPVRMTIEYGDGRIEEATP